MLKRENLVNRVNIPVERAFSFLQTQGIKVPSIHINLKKLARMNHTTPAQLYLLLLKCKKDEISSTPSLLERR